jgi:predicted DNA-binding transcriptional regulator AlpA
MHLDQNQQELLNNITARRQAQHLFSIEELAQFLGISVRTLRRMHAAGKAPPRIRRSKKLMYPVEAFLQWKTSTRAGDG